MTEDAFGAGISVNWVKTDEEPFVPKKGTEIFATLEPLEADNSTYWSSDYLKFYPNLLPATLTEYKPVPEFEGAQKELIINIETTSAKPWESRILCIGVLDPNALEPQTLNFIEETEEATLDAFMAWFNEHEYSVLIGYNVSFDYRFLYAVMQRYRKPLPAWLEMELYDLMQQQKQVKTQYVFGYNPTGTLEDWATYLLGTVPYADQSRVLDWFREGNLDEIANFNSDKLVKAYYLWVLNKVVGGMIPGAEVISRPSVEAAPEMVSTLGTTEAVEIETIQVACPNCMQEQPIPKTQKVINCHVCGTPVANPLF